MKKIFLYTSCLWLSACSLDAGGGRAFDPDKEFAKLDQPDVDTVEGSLLRAAKSSEEAGNHEKAISFYKQLIDKDRSSIPYMLGLAENIRKSGDAKASVTYYDIVLKQEPKNLDALEGRALGLMSAGSFPEAGDAFKDVMAIDSQRWRTLNGLGVLFALKEMFGEAHAYYDEALKFSPENVSVLNNKGLTYAIQRDTPGALDALNYASQVARSEPRKKQHVDMNLALVYGITGESQKAESIAAEHLKGPLLHNNLGLYAHLARNDELAKSYLNMALSHSPSHYENAWQNLDYVIGQSKGVTMKTNPGAKRIKVQ